MSERDTDLSHVHPFVRERITKVLETLGAEGIPFRVFEAFRTPQRQQALWEQGRTRAGAIVTKARPWTSYHQYGLAADFVLFQNNSWSWDDGGAKRVWWNRLQQVGAAHGLEALRFERPHLQMAGLDVGALQAGRNPPGGDASWAENLEAAITSWNGSPSAPPLPDEAPMRPPLPAEAVVVTPPPDAPLAGVGGWHRRFGGQEWRYDAAGVYLRRNGGGTQPLRSPGEPTTCRAIWALFAEPVIAAARAYGVPPAVILMTIATETGVYRQYGFTGPMTFRWEPDAEINDVAPPRAGDYSAGPMQTLAGSARWVIRAQHLAYDPFAVAPAYEIRPAPPPTHPLYDPATSIDIGTAEIKQRWLKTGHDPILVAAAYNAGGVYKSGSSAWGLRVYGNHLDRAAKWYGDACAVLHEQHG